jgi:pyruvate dehydrogenase E2 component (dihydrolipoamide acetyltransferase)
MARWEFKLPDIGEGVTEGEIVSWLVKPGDIVKDDQPMVEVMTDKATVTITSPRSGTIVETRGKPGEVVPVHAVLVVFELGATTQNGTNGHKKDDGPAATAVGDIKESLPGLGAPAPVASQSRGGAGVSARGTGGALQGYFNEKPLATPATRKMARDMNIDLRRVPPTGPQGRVTKRDVQSFVNAPGIEPSVDSNAMTLRPDQQPSIHAPSREAVKIVPPAGAQHAELEERVPYAGMRRRIATKMQTSKNTAAHFTFVEECDVTALKKLRARMNKAAEGQGVKLSFLPFIVKATVAALKKHPKLNAALDETTNEIVYRKYYNIGIAAATEAGLMVPVVRDCDKRSLLDIAREVERVASDARHGKSKLEDLQGSTFTITSLGAQGGLFATPIINFPEVAILGVHRIKERPIVKDGQIAIGEIMLLSLSFDHRLVDGHIGAAFAYDLIGYLEDPDRLFLEMA